MSDSSAPTAVGFDKYDQMGAYHWADCDRWSKSYNPPVEARYAVVARHFGKHRRVLDAGCGDAYLLSLLSTRVELGAGIDTERTGVKLGRRMLTHRPNIQLLCGSCYAIPFADASFDAVVWTDVIEHLTDRVAALREIARVLGPGGVLYLTTPKWRPDRRWDPRHEIEFTPEQLASEVSEVFADCQLSYFWPLRWSNWYATRYGWHLIKWFARYLYNPFLAEGRDPERFGQILAICKKRAG